MVICHFTRLLVPLFQPRITVNLLRAEIPRTIQGNEVAASQKLELAQLPAFLKLPMYSLEHRPDFHRLNIVKDGAHLGVARRILDAVDAPQVAVCPPTLIKCKQGRIFQREHGKTRHQSIRQRDASILCTPIRYPIKSTSNQRE